MSIPEACMQYTKVFSVFKLEVAIAIAVGVLIGYYFDRIGK